MFAPVRKPRQLWQAHYRRAVVPALGDPRREWPPAVYRHVINVPTHFNVPIRPSDERPPAMYGHVCLVPRVSVHDRYYCIFLLIWTGVKAQATVMYDAASAVV